MTHYCSICQIVIPSNVFRCNSCMAYTRNRPMYRVNKTARAKAKAFARHRQLKSHIDWKPEEFQKEVEKKPKPPKPFIEWNEDGSIKERKKND